MRKVNLNEIPDQERKSPKGKFGRASKNISIALGREPQSLDLSKRHSICRNGIRSIWRWSEFRRVKFFAHITRMRLSRSFT